MTSRLVATIGEPLVAFVAQDYGHLTSGSRLAAFAVGAEMNVAIGLTRLGIPTNLVGRVGDDDLGRLVVGVLRREGVDCEYLRTDADRPTGALVRNRRGFGRSNLTYLRTASAGAALSVEDVRAARGLIAAADWLHLTGITPALSDGARAAIEAAVDFAVSVRTPVSFDVNYRERLWAVDEARPVLEAVIGRAQLVFAGLDECRALFGADNEKESAAMLSERGAETVVVKLGQQGALCRERDGRITNRPAQPVATVVDIVGAGDAFVAGYLAAGMENLAVSTCLDWGATAAGFAISALGDAEALPSRDELEGRLAGMDDSQTWR